MPRYGKAARYENVAGAEEEEKPLQDDDSTNNDVPDSDLYELKRQLRRTNLYLRAILALIGVAATTFIVLHVAHYAEQTRIESGELYKPLIKTPVPPLKNTRVIFEKDFRYTQRPSPESDAIWNALLPDGRGFVFIPNAESYDYPPGQDTPWGQIYSTALFHQMHCLGQIRKYTWDLLESVEKNDTAKQTMMVDMLLGRDGGDHLNHCFDYLRQSIQCAGDMAMEWPRTEPDGRRFAVDGWGIPHECKDWSQIMEYMDEWHFNQSTNGDIAPHRR